MYLAIDGTDITGYIFKGGIAWQRSDVDAENSGRTLDGTMHRSRVATKVRYDITCRPLRLSELNMILNLILPEYVTVTVDDPLYGRVTMTMYSNNNPATYAIKQADGTEWWNGVSFPLIEV